ncbi:PI-actitoxin-Axm2b-like [Sitodiplosis mosellana]|uniref:PI-actitoxin-Axm2b-like n=1 Tax=Sitodiplosis mosellana TaxID=263140 RepID=UPI0024444F68|nr:PI-actitoxin-Axm2b-like [Sitodiplosis mosellana]
MKIFCLILIVLFAAATASSIQLTPGNICDLPALDKACAAPFKNWFYNSKTRKCEQHDGCGGNANRFETQTECEKACKK